MSAPLETSELTIHWHGLTSPAAPTVVLMHGLTDSGRCWPDAVARWEGRYRIAAVDALGHGSSPRYTDSQLDGEPLESMYAAAVTAVTQISGAGRNRPVLVGHSMGGGVSAALAARRPDLVRAVVLEDPAWVDNVDWVQRIADARERMADCQRFRDDLETALAKGRLEHPRWPECELLPWAQAKADSDERFLATGQAWLPTPWRDIVRAIAVPALVVTGSEDVIIDEPTAQAVAAVNAAIEIIVVEGAGHCVRRDDPQGFHAAVDPFLERHLGQPR